MRGALRPYLPFFEKNGRTVEVIASPARGIPAILEWLHQAPGGGGSKLADFRALKDKTGEFTVFSVEVAETEEGAATQAKWGPAFPLDFRNPDFSILRFRNGPGGLEKRPSRD